MILEKVVVSDANIFFDLISSQLLDLFFSLPCEISTTDFVISEIHIYEQQKAIQKFVKSQKLKVVTLNFTEIEESMLLQSKSQNNVSMADCSVWYYAKKIQGRLLTGDSKLRTAATKDKVAVSGILYIFDNLIEYGLLSPANAAMHLQALMKINLRLPRKECLERISRWK